MNKLINKELTMTSIEIAQLVNVRHDNVKRTIYSLVKDGVITSPQIEEKPTGGRLARNYIFSGEKGKRDSIIVVARLSPKFTANIVDRWIELEQSAPVIWKQDQWNETRLIGKSARRELTDTIQEFVEYAKKQGSKNAKMYYSNVTLMEYRALFIIGREISKSFRDSLTDFQLVALATAERVAVKAIQEGMESGINYKEIFKMARRRIDDLGLLLGKSLPGSNNNLLH